LDNFFLPTYHSSVQRAQGAQGAQGFAGTPERIAALRGACFVRDRHRCVVSRQFDLEVAIDRTTRDGEDARDDDGVLLIKDTSLVDTLEVAHILPHSLTKVGPSEEAALAILNMFDMGIAYLTEGADIDRPRNALTLTHKLHKLFGEFRIFFEATDQPHTYRIGTFLPHYLVRDPPLPITRTLYLAEGRAIDAPLPRLLAVHCAIAHILHLSAAGAYIDRILWDAEEHGIHADGSTELGRLVQLGLRMKLTSS